MAQCKPDTSGSSSLISALPPTLPIVISGRNNSYSVPCDGPAITDIVMILSGGRAKAVVCAFRRTIIEALDFLGDFAAIVGGPESAGWTSKLTIEVHIQHRTCTGRSV